MANQLKLQVILDVMDRASAPFRSINDKASKMGKAIKQSKAHLKGMQGALKGVQTQQMAMQSKGLTASSSLFAAEQKLQHEIDQTTHAIDKQKNALGRLNQKAKRLGKIAATGQRLESAGTGMMTGVSLPLGVGMGASVREAMDVERAMASIAKFAPDFKTLEDQETFLSNIKQSIADLSMQTGKTQGDIAAMYEEMGAAGVAADKWKGYSSTFLKGAVALDMEAGELSKTALGILASTGHKGDEKYLQKILEQANLSSDMGKMRAVNVLDVANRSMGMAKNAGIDESAFIGLTGAALDAGARDDVTGRAWKTIISRLTSTAKLTKAQQGAWDRLDIDPEVFTKAFKNDPIGQMEKLTQAAKNNADGMGELGIVVGTEFVDTIVKMGSNVETARKIQASLSDEQLRASKFQGEYNRMQATTDANWKRSVQTIKYLSATIGSQLLPQFNALLDRIKPIMIKIAEWVKANPKLTQTLLAIAGALVVVGPLLFATGKAISALMIISRVLPLITLLAGGFKILMAALVANPIGAAIAAITVGAVLLWQNWEKVSQWFSTNPFAVAIQQMPIVSAAIDFLSGSIETVTALFNGDWQGAWEGAKIVAVAAMNAALAPLKMVWELAKKLASYVGIDLGAAFEALRAACAPVLNFMKSSVGALVGLIGSAIDKFNALVNVSKKGVNLGKSAVGLGEDPSIYDAAVDGVGSLFGRKPTYGGRVKQHQAAAGKVKKIVPVKTTNNHKQTNNTTVNQSITVNAAKESTVKAIKAGAAKAAAAGARRGSSAKLSDSRGRF